MKTFLLRPDNISLHEVFLPFLTITAGCLVLLTGILLYHGKQEANLKTRMVQTVQADYLLSGREVISQELVRLQNDLKIIANIPGLRVCFHGPRHSESLDHITEMFRTFLHYKTYYYQLRFLDESGQEIIRVEQQDGQTQIIDKQDLQDNSKRYYMQDMADLDRGEIYFSPLGLNIDQGPVSRPYLPTLRLGRAIVNDQKQKIGYIILNYQGSDLFHRYQKIIHNPENPSLHPVNGIPLIVDRNGQYLLAGDPTDEWGLFLKHGCTFSRQFPKLWQQMQGQSHGQWLDEKGLFTMQRINLPSNKLVPHPNNQTDNTSASGLDHYLISHVKPAEMGPLSSPFHHFHWLFLLTAIPGILLISWLLALLLTATRTSRKQLQAERQNFHLLYEQAPLPYQSLDTKGRLQEVNQAWCLTLGYSKDEVAGREFIEFLAPASRQQFRDTFSDFLKQGQIHDCRFQLIRKDNSLLPAAFYGQLRRDQQDTIRKTHCVFIDITNLQEQEKRITHLNLVLQTIIHIHRSIARTKGRQQLLTECCRILTASRGYQSAWAVLLEEGNKPVTQASSGLPHNFKELFCEINKGIMPPCIRKTGQQNKAIAIASPQVFCHHCPMPNDDPSAEIMCAPLVHNSRIFGYLTVYLPMQLVQDTEELQRFSELAEDIAFALFTLEQKRLRQITEQELHKTLQVLQEAQDIAQIGSYERNWQTGEGTCSDSTYHIFGYEPGEIACTSKNFLAMVVPEDRQHIINEMERSQKQNKPFTTDFRISRKDGTIRIIHGTGRCVFDDAGSPLLYQGLFQDVTRQKKMEAHILQTEKLATIAGLAAGVSHELNTPLSAIFQSAQIIEMALTPDAEHNQKTATDVGVNLKKMQRYFKSKQIDFFLKGIRESAVRASSIVRDLLNFSRPGQKNMTRVNINDLLNSSLTLALADYELKKEADIINVEIIREYDLQQPQVNCVAMEIEQVLLNLIKNAAQAMVETDEKSRLILRTKQGEDMIHIEVEDNGPGIDEQTLKHIFDPFFTTKEIGKGTGLGLSVTYGIIHDKHKGTIRVKSIPGQGTTFFIDLPLKQPDIS